MSVGSNGSQLKVGVDIGGTFTDLVLVDSATGQAEVVKASTTPERPFARVRRGGRRVRRPTPRCRARYDRGISLALNAYVSPVVGPYLGKISFDVGEGECVALLGKNGMGKTTTRRRGARWWRSSAARRADAPEGGHALRR